MNHREQKYFIHAAMLFFLIGTWISGCGPTGASSDTTQRQKANSTDSVNSSESSSDANSDTSLSNEEEIRANLLSELPNDPSLEQLNSLHIGELRLLATERSNQNIAEKEQLELLMAMNSGLCKRLNSLREKCPAIKRIKSSGTVSLLNCDGTYSESTESESIFITTSSSIDTPMKLIANDEYQSSKFSGGTSEIRFQEISSSVLQAPKFLQIYKLVVVPFNKGDKLPSNSGLNIEIKVGANTLLNSPLSNSDDAKKARDKTEYKLDVSQIIQLRDSSRCKVDMAAVNDLKEQIKAVVVENQARQRTKEYLEGE